MQNDTYAYRVFNRNRLFTSGAAVELAENPICLIFSIFTFISWIIFAFLFWKRDKVVREEPEVEPLIDNVPLAEYFYQITVYTGTNANSGTTSDVGFRLSGINGRTEAHLFKTRTDIQNHKVRNFLPFANPKRGFTRGSARSFLLGTKQKLGDLTAVRIWHDSRGRSPEWYLHSLDQNYL